MSRKKSSLSHHTISNKQHKAKREESIYQYFIPIPSPTYPSNVIHRQRQSFYVYFMSVDNAVSILIGSFRMPFWQQTDGVEAERIKTEKAKINAAKSNEISLILAIFFLWNSNFLIWRLNSTLVPPHRF